MSVRVHEPGRKRRVAKIDYLRPLRNREIAAGVADRVALDNNNAVCDERLCFAVEESSCFQDDDVASRIGSASCSWWKYNRREDKEAEEAEEAKFLHACEYEIARPKARRMTLAFDGLKGELRRGQIQIALGLRAFENGPAVSSVRIDDDVRGRPTIVHLHDSIRRDAPNQPSVLG